MNNDDKINVRAFSIQIFVHQFKRIIKEKFKVFVLEVATSGLHLNLMQLHGYCSNHLLYHL